MVAGAWLPVVVPGRTSAEPFRVAPTPRTVATVPPTESVKVVPRTALPAAELKDQRWVRVAVAVDPEPAQIASRARTRVASVRVAAMQWPAARGEDARGDEDEGIGGEGATRTARRGGEFGLGRPVSGTEHKHAFTITYHDGDTLWRKHGRARRLRSRKTAEG